MGHRWAGRLLDRRLDLEDGRIGLLFAPGHDVPGAAGWPPRAP
jgi:hypothetical protein